MDCRASNLQPYQPSLWPKTATSGSERGTKDCGSSTAGISTGRYQTGQVRARQLKHPVIDGELSVFRIVEDRDRHLWISSNRGCFEYIPSHGDFKTGQWINYTHNGDDPNSLCSNFTTDIYPDTVTDNKTIWIGTRSG